MVSTATAMNKEPIGDEDESERGSEEELELDQSQLEYVLVHRSQLELLFQRCPQGGKFPGERATPPKRKRSTTGCRGRTLSWKSHGANVTVSYYCGHCKPKKPIRWSAQPFIEGTRMRHGGLAITAAATVAPVDYPNLDAFFRSLKIPLLKKRSFQRIKQHYVNSVVTEAYKDQQLRACSNAINKSPNGLEVAMDAQFDSPGYCGHLCRVTAMDVITKKILSVEIMEKHEVDNKSTQMELLGVKRNLEVLTKHKQVPSVTIDKNSSVMPYFNQINMPFFFDTWHVLSGLSKQLRSGVKELKKLPVDQQELRALGRRLLFYLWNSVPNALGDPNVMTELALSFFLHVIGIHRWEPKKLAELIKLSPETKTGKNFGELKFNQVLQCRHEELGEEDTAPVDAYSHSYQKLIGIIFKPRSTFARDMSKLKQGNSTSNMESAHSVYIGYSPKRKFYPKKQFEERTMLAVMHWNNIQDDEQSGQRQVLRRRPYFSKASGEERMKIEKSSGTDTWKRKIVERVIERKQILGPGLPNLEDEDIEYEIDETRARLEQLTLLEYEEESEMSEGEMEIV